MLHFLAVLRQFRDSGYDPRVIVKHLAEHPEDIAAILSFVMAIFSAKATFAAASAEGEPSEEEFVAECRAMGCDEGDCREILNHLPEAA